MKFRVFNEETKSIEGKGYFLSEAGGLKKLVNGCLIEVYDNNLSIEVATGCKDIDGNEIFEDDIIVAECYPFYSDGDHNYSASIFKQDGSWYYDMFPVSDRVCGYSVGDSLSCLVEEGVSIKIDGHYKNIDEYKSEIKGKTASGNQ